MKHPILEERVCIYMSVYMCYIYIYVIRVCIYVVYILTRLEIMHLQNNQSREFIFTTSVDQMKTPDLESM